MKKIITLVLALAMLLSLAACGGNGGGSSNGGLSGGNGGGANLGAGYYIGGDQKVTIGTPSNPLNAEQVYASLTYTPEMFYGNYRILGGDGGINNYKNEMDYVANPKDEDYSETDDTITAIPFQFVAGPENMSHKVNQITHLNWVCAYFQTQGGNLTFMNFAYEVEGTKLVLTYLEEFKVDEERGVITYKLGDYKLEYDFKFKGRDLTLSAGGKSVTMRSGLAVYEDEAFLSVEHYLSKESATVDNIDYIGFLYSNKGQNNRITFEDKDGNSFYNTSIAHMSDDGLFTFMIPWESGAKTYQFVYFLCGKDGIVLTDGTSTYYFNDTYYSRYYGHLGANLSIEDAGKIEHLPETKVEDLVQKKEDLFAELEAAFKAEGINVTVNRDSGEISMDATVLFGGDSAVVTDAGKALLDKFINVYTSVIFSEKYEGFISKTMVEGHTAPVAGTTYEDGIPLSEQRAANVKAYCIAGQSGLSSEHLNALTASMDTIGYSCGKPIYNADGTVNMAACRRVSFKFLINLDY